ncbi:hypothetical protein M1N59_02185 [Dehalococcoidales bacterium]|nr:hypothetical protein [Dehalococcoidales bacterium]
MKIYKWRMMKPGILIKYKDFLPITPNTLLFSLGEENSRRRLKNWLTRYNVCLPR